MQVVRWPGSERPCRRASVATLGVFDGVHRGHAEILDRVRSEALARGYRSVVITFDRHPGAIVRESPQPAITSLEHKLRLFESFGLDVCVVVRFDREVADMPAAEFARIVFTQLLDARLLVLGEDCRFGRNREGDVAACRRFGADMGYEVHVVAPVAVSGERVSSTAIRQAILAGDLARAAALLGRPFSLYGTVVHGDGRGRSLGYPTANVDPHNETIPPDGVYAAWAYIAEEPLRAVVSVGRRETFSEQTDGSRVVEVHLIDCRQELYGRNIEARFVRRLRAQQTFADVADLVAQMDADVSLAGDVLAQGDPPGRR
jgi:riboflavin kinase/FMN adenylyltransferase